MNIIISGYGKMGKMVETEALKAGDCIVAKIDSKEDWAKYDFEAMVARGNVAAIDFSTPQSVVANIEECFKRNIPIVVGTTGWYNEKERLKELCQSKNQSMFWASNFSIGIFLFNKMNIWLAKLMNSYSQYTPSMSETHHVHKLDAPSGTAITLAENLIENYHGKTKWQLGESQDKDTLCINAIRQGEVCGIHEVKYESPFDEITIRHEAKTRAGFALGAVTAAHWLADKKGFFTMSDMLDQMSEVI